MLPCCLHQSLTLLSEQKWRLIRLQHLSGLLLPQTCVNSTLSLLFFYRSGFWSFPTTPAIPKYYCFFSLVSNISLKYIQINTWHIILLSDIFISANNLVLFANKLLIFKVFPLITKELGGE